MRQVSKGPTQASFFGYIYELSHWNGIDVILLQLGGYFKDERSLGGRRGWPNAASVSNNAVIAFSNFVLREGEGVEKVILAYAPLHTFQSKYYNFSPAIIRVISYIQRKTGLVWITRSRVQLTTKVHPRKSGVSNETAFHSTCFLLHTENQFYIVDMTFSLYSHFSLKCPSIQIIDFFHYPIYVTAKCFLIPEI